jgi:hypothetical protein
MTRPEAREREADEEGERQDEDRRPGLREAERRGDDQHRGARKEGLRGRPDPLGEHHVLEAHRRVEDALPRALHVHAREARVERLEGRRHHRRVADGAAGEERDVAHALDLGHERAEADAEAREVESGSTMLPSTDSDASFFHTR